MINDDVIFGVWISVAIGITVVGWNTLAYQGVSSKDGDAAEEYVLVPVAGLLWPLILLFVSFYAVFLAITYYPRRLGEKKRERERILSTPIEDLASELEEPTDDR